MKSLLIILVGMVVLAGGCIQQAGTANGAANASPAAPPPACTGGSASLSVAGTASYNGSQFSDACVSNASVKKFYCDGGQVRSMTADCPQDSACEAGACAAVREPVRPAAKCVSTSPVVDYYTAGSVTYNGTTYSDVCQGLYSLVKYSCDNDAVSQSTYHCPVGDQCERGACVHLDRTCTDTDAQDQSAAGTTTLYGGGVVISQMHDACVNSTTLTEYGCGNGIVVNTTVTCAEDYYCSGGACLPPCVATASGVTAGGTAYSNACKDNRTFVRYTCYGSSVSRVELPCETFCHGGACVPATSLSCTRSQNGVQIRYNGDVLLSQDNACVDYQTAKAYACDSSKMVFSYQSCSDDEVCQSGNCVAIARPGCFVVSTGTEGDVHYKSSVILTSNRTVTSVRDNYCLSTVILVQYYCNDGAIGANYVNCPAEESCQDGICVYPYMCRETAVRSAASAGAATLYDGTNPVRTEKDVCSGDGVSIREVGCGDNGRITYSIVSCPAGMACNSETGTCG